MNWVFLHCRRILYQAEKNSEFFMTKETLCLPGLLGNSTFALGLVHIYIFQGVAANVENTVLKQKSSWNLLLQILWNMRTHRYLSKDNLSFPEMWVCWELPVDLLLICHSFRGTNRFCLGVIMLPILAQPILVINKTISSVPSTFSSSITQLAS